MNQVALGGGNVSSVGKEDGVRSQRDVAVGMGGAQVKNDGFGQVVVDEAHLLLDRSACSVTWTDVEARLAGVTILKDLYDKVGGDYPLLVKRTSYKGYKWAENKLLEKMPSSPVRVLDLGCADGLLAEGVKQFRSDDAWVGVDYSSGMVKAARERDVYEIVYEQDLSLGLSKEILMSEEKYSALLAVGCLEFVQDHKRLLGQLKNLLNPEGWFFFTVEKKTEDGIQKALDTDRIVYCKEEILLVLNDAGFDMVSCTEGDAYTPSVADSAVAYFYIEAQLNQK